MKKIQGGKQLENWPVSVKSQHLKKTVMWANNKYLHTHDMQIINLQNVFAWCTALAKCSAGKTLLVLLELHESSLKKLKKLTQKRHKSGTVKKEDFCSPVPWANEGWWWASKQNKITAWTADGQAGTLFRWGLQSSLLNQRQWGLGVQLETSWHCLRFLSMLNPSEWQLLTSKETDWLW